MNVSSVAHKLFGQLDLTNLNAEKSVVMHSLYAHTKLAQILFTRELSKRLHGTGMLFLSVSYKTNLPVCYCLVLHSNPSLFQCFLTSLF